MAQMYPVKEDLSEVPGATGDGSQKNGMKVWRGGKKEGRSHHPYKEIFDV